MSVTMMAISLVVCSLMGVVLRGINLTQIVYLTGRELAVLSHWGTNWDDNFGV